MCNLYLFNEELHEAIIVYKLLSLLFYSFESFSHEC